MACLKLFSSVVCESIFILLEPSIVIVFPVKNIGYSLILLMVLNRIVEIHTCLCLLRPKIFCFLSALRDLLTKNEYIFFQDLKEEYNIEGLKW